MKIKLPLMIQKNIMKLEDIFFITCFLLYISEVTVVTCIENFVWMGKLGLLQNVGLLKPEKYDNIV